MVEFIVDNTPTGAKPGQIVKANVDPDKQAKGKEIPYFILTSESCTSSLTNMSNWKVDTMRTTVLPRAVPSWAKNAALSTQKNDTALYDAVMWAVPPPPPPSCVPCRDHGKTAQRVSASTKETVELAFLSKYDPNK